jgi:hypothetical protein
MNDAVFGKTIDTVRKREDMQLLSDKQQIRNIFAKPQF